MTDIVPIADPLDFTKWMPGDVIRIREQDLFRLSDIRDRKAAEAALYKLLRSATARGLGYEVSNEPETMDIRLRFFAAHDVEPAANDSK